MRAAFFLLPIAIAGCGIPVKESFWRPEASQGYLENRSTCDLGNSDSLVVPLSNGVRIETLAETSEGDFVATYVLHGIIKGRPSNAVVTLEGEYGVIEVPLVRTSSEDAMSLEYEARWPQVRGTKVKVTLPTFAVGGGEIVNVPPITYTYGSHMVLKCLNM